MITLKKIPTNDLQKIWQISYAEKDPDWVKTDAPFLHDYIPLTWEEFKLRETTFFQSNQVQGIYLNDKPIGAVTYYWEDETTRWLEVGISIFDTSYWSKGYGSFALKKWTSMMFEQHPTIQRVGFSTWSGNSGMIAIGKKLNFTLEGQLRQVRYYQGNYYDAIKMGVLRDEWLV